MDVEQMVRDMDAAKRGQGKYRAMRVTMECGHLRLMAHINTVMGIGAEASCRLCPPENFSMASRTVVNVEETGVLSKEYGDRVQEGLPV